MPRWDENYSCPDCGEEFKCPHCDTQGLQRRIKELEAARDSQVETIRRLQGSMVTFQIGEAHLTGSRENVEKAKATLAHLKAKAGTDLPRAA